MLTPSTTTVDLNVGYPNIATVVHAVQGDNQSRILTANLYDGGIAWTPPTGAVGVIKFNTPLGTSGMYDTDEEGNTAVTWTGNVATLRIVQNALAVAGDVPMQLSFYDNQGAVITSFLWETLVQPSVLTDTQFMQTDYYNILSQQISAILTAIADIPEPATSAPLMDGTAAVGTQNTFARGDHRHPTDTSRAPTNHASTDTTYGAASTTNYGHVKLSNTTPSMDGTAAVGSSTDAARANHVHPSDTSRVPTTRKINNMDLTADRTLTAENISYDDGLSVHTSGSVGEELSELKGSLNSITPFDTTPTNGSAKGVTSDGVFDFFRNAKTLNNNEDLDTLYGNGSTGFYYVAANVVNAPFNYCGLIVIGTGASGGFQIMWQYYGAVAFRNHIGNPAVWSDWTYVPEDPANVINGVWDSTYVNSSLDCRIYASVSNNVAVVSGFFNLSTATTNSNTIIGNIKALNRTMALPSGGGFYGNTIGSAGSLTRIKITESSNITLEKPTPAGEWFSFSIPIMLRDKLR